MWLSFWFSVLHVKDEKNWDFRNFNLHMIYIPCVPFSLNATYWILEEKNKYFLKKNVNSGHWYLKKAYFVKQKCNFGNFKYFNKYMFTQRGSQLLFKVYWKQFFSFSFFVIWRKIHENHIFSSWKRFVPQEQVLQTS